MVNSPTLKQLNFKMNKDIPEVSKNEIRSHIFYQPKVKLDYDSIFSTAAESISQMCVWVSYFLVDKKKMNKNIESLEIKD